jgi:NAD-dependent SIR2 family protein deacetylase
LIENSRSLDRAASLIQKAQALIITAGAGLGVDSGLPDFRGNDGFWKAYPALQKSNIAFKNIANLHAFKTMPKRAWGFYGHRLNLYRVTQPHAGFSRLLGWGRQKKYGYSVFTSNVDGQFQRAGFDQGLINECHGSIERLQCLENCSTHIWPADEFTPDIDEEGCYLKNALPRCDQCDSIARPNIYMFNDGGWIENRQREQQAAQDRWLKTIEQPVVVELGAGTAIPSVRDFGEKMGRQFGATLIRINPRQAEVDRETDVGLPMGAAAAIAALNERLEWLG